MRTPLAFLRFLAKASLNAVSNGVAGDFAVEVLPDMARNVWKWWTKDRDKGQLQAEVQALAALSPAEVRQAAGQVAAEVAADQPEAVRRNLETFLTQVPATIRQSQRLSAAWQTPLPIGAAPAPAAPAAVAADPVPDIHLSLCQPLDLVPLLPTRLPRFRAGDRPAGIGDWELEELLGAGGFGEVWKARNPHLGEPVALKFCLDEKVAPVLRNEAALLGRVKDQGRHPGIVQLRHTYLSADPPCLEYEFVSGGDLACLITRWHRAGAPPSLEQITRLLRQLVEVLAFAHRLQPPIVHRDLKPANVLVEDVGQVDQAADEDVVLRVADFGIGGIARVAAGRTTTRTPSMLSMLRGAHTPLYASPQQLLGHDPDPRDDVYSLGVIGYQLLTGNLAIPSLPADWQDDLAERGVPEVMVRLLRSCLAAQPDRRLASAAVLLEELDALMRPAEPATVPAAPRPSGAVKKWVPAQGWVWQRPLGPPPPPAPQPTPAEDLAEQVRQALRRIGEVHVRARHLAEQEHEYAPALELLDEVPEHLRDNALYADLCRRRDRVAELDRQVRLAVTGLRLAEARRWIEELLLLCPQRDDLRRLLTELPPEARLDARLTNSLGMKLVLVPSGKFLMGSPRSELERHGNEWLPHEVEIARPFYLGLVPVTQQQFRAVMGRNPSWFIDGNHGGPRHPVERVSWYDAEAFCRSLTALPEEVRAHRVYRLPTEAEWEYACRAGTTTPFSFGVSACSEQANFDGRRPYGGGAPGRARRRTSKVGCYPANPWGLLDMHGNVWEWCADVYDGPEERDVPAGGAGSADRDRVLRGGSWFNDGGHCRSACRLRRPAGDHDFNIGFRVVLSIQDRPGA
jgi:formylglycine-generating enzyme required for sulfatase activity/serine/threonine protein kinase